MELNSILIPLFSGAAAGTITDLAFFPIDTIKTRIQAKNGFLSNGGWKGIYKGVGSTIIASAPGAGLFFLTYERIKHSISGPAMKIFPNKDISYGVTHIIAASLGEIAACLVRVPSEVIKQRAQAAKYDSSLLAFKAILNNTSNEGLIRGLYRGWTSTIMREIPFTSIQFPLYEFFKHKWAINTNRQKVSLGEGAICGSVAGGIAAAITTPLDVIKTRIMLNKERIGIRKIIKEMYESDGPLVFFRGVGPRVLWISAGGCIFLGVYEVVKEFSTSFVNRDDALRKNLR